MEQLVHLLVLWSVVHLLFPRALQVLPKKSTQNYLLSQNFLLLPSLILNCLQVDLLCQKGLINLLLMSYTLLFVVWLVSQLLLQLPVHEYLLPSVLGVDLQYHISGLLGAEVGLVILLVNLILGALNNLRRGNLLLNHCLVSLHVALMV